MDPKDRERIRRRYDERFAQYGADPRTLASGPESRHTVRFSVLRDLGIHAGASVLDIGCGFGDFYQWLRSQGIDVQYTGVDINPTLIDVAGRRHAQARFLVRDLQDEPLAERFDYVVSSSAFNVRLEAIDNYAFVADMLARAYTMATHGVAIDFLSSYVDFTGDDVFHYAPERVFALAKRLTKRVCLRHDYPLFEFCVYLYPDFQGWRAER